MLLVDVVCGQILPWCQKASARSEENVVNTCPCPTGPWFKSLHEIKGCKDLLEGCMAAAPNDVCWVGRTEAAQF